MSSGNTGVISNHCTDEIDDSVDNSVGSVEGSIVGMMSARDTNGGEIGNHLLVEEIITPNNEIYLNPIDVI